MKFTENDIQDKERLERMIEKEAIPIFNSPTANANRDLETVKFCVRQGKIAELYLIENCGYDEADLKYHDLKEKLTGNYVEVKAYDIPDASSPRVQIDLRRLRNANWNISKEYILFKVHSDGVYEFLEKIKIK